MTRPTLAIDDSIDNMKAEPYMKGPSDTVKAIAKGMARVLIGLGRPVKALHGSDGSIFLVSETHEWVINPNGKVGVVTGQHG